MSFINSWVAHDGRLVLMCDKVISTFEAHRQVSGMSESGGVLLGRRRGKHFEVVHATAPMLTDQCSPVSFIRNSAGHQEQAIALWEQSRGEIGYIGEWHTHAEDKPRPSRIDTMQWFELAEREPVHCPKMAVIVGLRQLYVALLRYGEAIEILKAY
ncbi:Mov34/MPN/PAD-1 family protein [Paraburkholderia terrae]